MAPMTCTRCDLPVGPAGGWLTPTHEADGSRRLLCTACTALLAGYGPIDPPGPCSRCGADVVRSARLGPRYCSNACRQAAYRSRLLAG
jgi:hypothetical protein